MEKAPARRQKKQEWEEIFSASRHKTWETYPPAACTSPPAGTALWDCQETV